MGDSPSRAMTEDQLLEAVRAYARLMGWLTFHTHDSRRSEPGFPDLVCIRGGKCCFIELKSERGKVSPEQQLWLAELADVECYSMGGVNVYVWRPQDWLSGRIEEILK